jgi:hypothetical protein
VAVLGLFIQVTGVAISPLALCCAPLETTVAERDGECAHAMAPGEMCPMRHHAKPPATAPSASEHHHAATPEPADDDCVMTQGCKMPDLALMSVLGEGIMPPPVSLSVLLESTPVAPMTIAPLARDAVPDTPPPRS